MDRIAETGLYKGLDSLNDLSSIAFEKPGYPLDSGTIQQRGRNE
jgi:hypothetical protein